MIIGLGKAPNLQALGLELLFRGLAPGAPAVKFQASCCNLELGLALPVARPTPVPLRIGKTHLRSAASLSQGSSSVPIGIDTLPSIFTSLHSFCGHPSQQQESFCPTCGSSLCLAVYCNIGCRNMHALKTCASTALRHASRRGYATVSSSSAYSQTIPNLRINSETKVIYQGFTGKLSIACL